MRVYIPSFKRAHLIFAMGTAVYRMAAENIPVTVVVRDTELHDYQKYMTNACINNIELIGVEKEHYPIALKRGRIGEIAQSRGEHTFLMMDDDLTFYQRKSEEVYNLVDIESFVPMIEKIKLLLGAYVHVGVSMREGQNRHPIDGVDGFVLNTRICRVHAFRTAAFNLVEHGRVQFMEDFDVALQLLRKGYDNCTITHYAQGQKATQTEGGCSEMRTHANHEASAIGLHNLHPQFVKLRDKKNKGGGEFGTRKEVTIYWKKARASGG